MKKIKFDENFVAENVRQIIELLGVSATAEVSQEDNSFLVDISSEDSPILIGKYGANLEALQFVLAIRLKTLSGDNNFEVFVDVDNWRKNRELKLQKMAISLADKVTQSGQPENLYNLKPSERKVIHSTLTDHPSVLTISEGEEPNRYLIIKPRTLEPKQLDN